MSGTDSAAYLDPQTVSRLSRLDLIARLVVEGFITGLHRSPYHGFSVEFSEHRPYLPGDALRDLDWKAYAKSGRPYVKLYEEETNLRAWLLLDASGSMAFQAGGPWSKFRYAASLAAALAHLLLRQRDAVGLALFRDRLETVVPPRSVQSHLQVLLHAIDQVQPASDTGVARSFQELAERISRRGLVVVLSDLLDEPEQVLQGLKFLRHRGHEVVVFQILDPRERDLGFQHETRFYDLEDPAQVLATQPAHLRAEYRLLMDDLVRQYRQGCANARIDYALLDTATPFDVALSQYLVRRRRMG
ncbi:MAG: DUF58 domain-containing protein [Candidatus Latescibacterota bacterium]|jgi:uncharacterized protein (DUF58 family)